MIRHLIVCMVCIAFGAQCASAQEQAPKAPVDEKYARVVQTLLDLDEKLERLGDLHEKDIADCRHQQVQLREECAALQAKVRQLEEDLKFEKDLRKMRERADDIAKIERQLAATRIVSSGRLGLRTQQVYVVTGDERVKLTTRLTALKKESKQAMTTMLTRILDRFPVLTVAPISFPALAY